ncbi:DUF3888 domain-containing protein [Paenibacillus terrigena]|uniref:DUF3888 domain-containing protein n=1 Tax=Paenibacillus terrigena TaxID=369333 RepID=UPI001FDEC8E4|nr:DUF3888 domain-containing protein [Paenibacillus terrigena]
MEKLLLYSDDELGAIMIRKTFIVYVVIFLLVLNLQSQAIASKIEPKQDSRQLQFQDMLVLFLLPHMNDKLREVYAKDLKASPELYPYFVNVSQVERVNGFRGFDFLITLHAIPTVGPHIPVGEDLFTFEITPGVVVKLVNFKHLKGPNKMDFPPNYQDLLR